MEGAIGFLLRNPLVEGDLIAKILPAIPLSDSDSHLKKAFLLKSLQHSLSTVSIDKPILHILEMLEELHRTDGSPVTAAMSAAYCAVAVECTLKYLQVEVQRNFLYSCAVEKIWCRRISHMHSFGDCEGSLMHSEELQQWRSDIQASLLDLQVRERLSSIDTRRDAINKLKVYLAEAWADLGPSFPEVAAVHTNKALAVEHLELQHQDREIQEITEAASEVAASVHTNKALATEHLEAQHQEREIQEITEATSEVVASMHTNKAVATEHSEVQHQEGEMQKITEAVSEEVHYPLLNSLEVNKEAAMIENDQASVPHSPVRINEYDDSIDGGHEKRRHLRRKTKKWSQLETETLKAGVDRFGKGNWKIILNSYKDIFEERTHVNLKDKWRNMTRHGCN